MTHVIEKYRKIYTDCGRLLDAALQLSVSTSGRKADSRELYVGSSLFAKLILHARAAHALAPRDPLVDGFSVEEIWDISSVAVLVRAEIDTYYVFFYIAADNVDPELREFRWLLWDHHAEVRGLKKLRLSRSSSDTLSNIERDVQNLHDRITVHPVYLKQRASLQKKLRDGDLGIFSTNTDLSERAGIAPAYYKSVFMYLSSYVHKFPFSVQQLEISRAGEKKSLRIISTILHHASMYLSLASRDFALLFPQQTDTISPEIWSLIDTLCGIARTFSGMPDTDGS